jgi:hypothetical protein
MGRIIVEFPECREVFCDGASQGNNRNEEGKYRELIIGNGLHTFRLGGNADFTPASQPFEVTADGDVISAQHIIFTKKA